MGLQCRKGYIHPETQLILNADDPLVSCFGYGRDNVVWFGAGNLPTDTKGLSVFIMTVHIALTANLP